MTRKIDEVLQAAVARGDVPGVVALTAGDDGVLYEVRPDGGLPMPAIREGFDLRERRLVRPVRSIVRWPGG